MIRETEFHEKVYRIWESLREEVVKAKEILEKSYKRAR